MKGLLLKDIYVFTKQMKWITIIIGLYIIIPVFNADFYMFWPIAILLAVLQCVSLISYDEKSKWEKYSLTMPLSRKDIVLSRYIFGVGFAGIISVLILILNTAAQFIRYKTVSSELFVNVCILFAGAVIMMSIILPLIFKFGSEKGRIVYLVVIVFVGIIVGSFFGFMESPGILSKSAMTSISENIVVISLLGIILSLIVGVISFLISCVIYNKKQFS